MRGEARASNAAIKQAKEEEKVRMEREQATNLRNKSTLAYYHRRLQGMMWARSS
jgi:hypothetical protein